MTQLDYMEEKMLFSLWFKSDDPHFNDIEAMCESIRGWELYSHPDTPWDYYGTRVAGLTTCQWGVVEIGSREGMHPFQQTPYVHEFAHAIQKCDAPLPLDPGTDGYHANWQRSGIYSAIEYATRW